MLTKFASYEVSEILDLKSAPARQKTASFSTISEYQDYRTNDDYLYVRIRAISSRCNKNWDGWPTQELAGGSEAWDRISSQHQASEGGFTVEAKTNEEYGYSTFVGKPIFVDHNNSDPKRARGAIVDAKFNVLDHKTAAEGDKYWGSKDVDPEHLPPSEIELLLEVDAKEFPKFAKAVAEGELDGFSMGCDVDYSKCSHCGHKASSPDEYCSHIVMKGAEHDFKTADGTRTAKRSYENCYGVKFFEISGVFEPADETALAKEVIAQKVATLEDEVHANPDVHQIEQLARQVMSENPGMTLEEAMPYAQSELMNRFAIDPSQVKGGDGYDVQEPKRWDYKTDGPSIPVSTPRFQGSYLASKTAEAPEPQSMKVHAPEDINTLREEKICPLCGSDMDADKCAVCGFEEPPEQFQNPDLQKAHDVDLTQQGQDEVTIPADDGTEPPADAKGESYLNARNPQPTASVKSDMRWAPKGVDLPKTAADKPQGDEPNETVISDQTTPITSSFRTAKELIASAAKRNQEKNMSNQTKVAADPADPSGKAKERVDVEGVGGVDEASAEAASKADAQVDVEGKGGVLDASNQSASAPDEKQSINETSENAGFDDGGDKSNNSGPTKTFPNSNEPDSAVTDKAVEAANKGTQPADPSGKADDRIDVETPPHDQVGPGTDQWTGTNGNGVTRQQDPVTKVVDPNIEQHSSGLVSLAALKLADTEVDLGITSPDKKFDRLAELGDLSDIEINAEQRALAKVKTAGMTRTASKGGVHRVPSFRRVASVEQPEPQPVDDALLDSALYSR